MPTLIPFRAIRPVPHKVHLVVSRSYISYEEKALEQKLLSNPYSFIHIINPDFHHKDRAPAGSRRLFERVRERFEEFKEQEHLMQDEEASFYVYEQLHADYSFTGIIGATSAKDYREGRIKKHEATLTNREQMFKQYLEVTGFNAEPVLLTYPDNKEVDRLTSEAQHAQPLYDFNTTDSVRHRLWRVDAESDIQRLKECFDKVEDFYIADGHHRSASSALLAEKKQEADDPACYCMSFLVPFSQVRVEPFHRLVRDKRGRKSHEILAALKQHFSVRGPMAQFTPEHKGQMGIYIEENWYSIDNTVASGELDAQYCSDHILAPIFDIQDLRTDKHIRFVPGIEDAQMIESIVDSGQADLAITLYPSSMEEVVAISDIGGIMPPKSTYVLPKLRSALTIYDLEKK